MAKATAKVKAKKPKCPRQPAGKSALRRSGDGGHIREPSKNGRDREKPVVDETGLTGRYDLLLRWTADDSQSLIDALEKETGLKLTPAKRFVEVGVVRAGDWGGTPVDSPRK